MKKLIILIIMIVPVLLINCDTLDELATIDLNTTFNKSVDVAIGENDPTTIDETITVSATDDSEINKYKDVIENYDVKEISYMITSYTGDPGVTFSGTFSVEGLTHTINELDVNALYSTGESVLLDYDQADLDEIAQALLAGNEITATVVGEVSDKPVSFTIKFDFEVGFSAKVI